MKHEVHGPCIPFKGIKDRHGYGYLKIGGKTIGAHALALRLSLGRSLGPGMFALHKCHNPPCINPEHLYEGTQADNVRDAWDRGTLTGAVLSPFTSASRKYHPEVYEEIVRRARAGESGPAISRAMNIPRGTISRYITMYNKGLIS